MSLNGAGVYSVNTAGQPVVNGTAIDATVFNNLMTDIATALSTAMFKDGQQTVTANIPLGGYKITGLGLGTATTDAAAVQNANLLSMCEFRLTLTSNTPVTTADVTAAETLYFTPYKGNRIALYNGSAWVMRTSAEMSIDVPDVTGVHDVFVYDNAGTPTLEVLVWATDTTRATALAALNGVLVKNGDSTRRYVGTFYSTTAGNGQIEDSVANRYLWNYYNRVERPMRVLEATASWAYSLTTIRQANASTANQLNFVIGVSEDLVSAEIRSMHSASSAGYGGSSGIGLDATNSYVATQIASQSDAFVAAYKCPISASARIFPGIGKHYLSWNEASGGTVTHTFYGAFNAGGLFWQSGIHGTMIG